MAQNRHWEQDKDATVYIGNIDERATPAMVYEIMLQMGPIHNIHMPRDRVTQSHQGFGFVEFRSPPDAEYAANVINGIKLYGKSLRVNKASADKQKGADVGAELFVGNLDAMVDEKILYDTFSRFGPLLNVPKVARDENAVSKGFAFVSFADFESSDAAIANLHGQYLLSKEISVQYAFKKDGKGERHGDEAERQLAAQAKSRNIVPDTQPVPQAFLPPPSQPVVSQPPPSAPAGAFDHSSAPSMIPGGGVPMPMVPPTAPAGPPAGFVMPTGPRRSHYSNTPGNGVPSSTPPPRTNMPLPPAPVGLPSRPPHAGGYVRPADYHPAQAQAPFRPPPGTSQAPPPVLSNGPPPGFPAVAPPGGPPGASGMPPGGPPPGFAPPPGGFAPPPGFPRR